MITAALGFSFFFAIASSSWMVDALPLEYKLNGWVAARQASPGDFINGAQQQTAATPGFSLFVNACLDGTLHGKPMKVCQEHSIRHYETFDKCGSAIKAGTVTDWVNMMHVVGIDVDVRSYRCGPAEPEGDDI